MFAKRLMSGFFTVCKDVRIYDIHCLKSFKKSEKRPFYEVTAELWSLNTLKPI